MLQHRIDAMYVPETGTLILLHAVLLDVGEDEDFEVEADIGVLETAAPAYFEELEVCADFPVEYEEDGPSADADDFGVAVL